MAGTRCHARGARPYLTSRKGRTLTLDKIEQVERIANVLDLTADQMFAIDTASPAALPSEPSEQQAA